MKKIGKMVSILIAGLLLVAGCSEAKAMPQDLATATQKIVDEVKDQDSSVFEEIQRNVDMVSRLKQDIETSRETNKQKLLNKVIKELEKVTLSYEELAGRRESIRKTLLSKITALEKLQEKVEKETTRLKEQRSDYTAMLRTLNDPNPEIMRTRKEALTQAIEYVDMQLKLWNEFHGLGQEIRSETVAVQQRVDSFLSIIESSAILFREGLNLLELQRGIDDALSLFTQDMPRMEQLSRDMERSWSHLDMLVNTLTSMSISMSHD